MRSRLTVEEAEASAISFPPKRRIIATGFEEPSAAGCIAGDPELHKIGNWTGVACVNGVGESARQRRGSSAKSGAIADIDAADRGCRRRREAMAPACAAVPLPDRHIPRTSRLMMTLSVGPLTQTSEPPGPNLLTCDASAVPRLLLLTKSDAADQLGISLRTIEGPISSGQLPLVYVEGAARLRVSDLEAFVQRLEADAGPRSVT